MRPLLVSSLLLATTSFLSACGSDSGGSGGGGGSGGSGGSCPVMAGEGDGGSNITHVILVVQENHTFDNYFGTYCTAKTGSNPTCTEGPACCEAAPATEPGGAAPVVLDDEANAGHDPDHTQKCELAEMNGGKMDRYVAGAEGCSDPGNFALAGDAAAIYRGYAAKYALADRNFQPLVGQSSSNDMYFAVAKQVFKDNEVKPDAIGAQCELTQTRKVYEGQTVFDVIGDAKKTYRVYAEGYAKTVAAGEDDCPHYPTDCAGKLPTYPCIYTPSDIPFLYYKQFNRDPDLVHDYKEIAADISGGTLPNLSYVKLVGYHTEHPGYGTTISPGVEAVDALIKSVEASCYAANTLVLVAWDEGGGFFDHVVPPADSTADGAPYGTRVPLLAIGRFARKNFVSHVELEHSSVVKFLELNFTGKTGQLAARDALVHNIGSLLDPKETGITIPED